MRISIIQDVYINNLSDSSIFVCGSVGRIQSSFAGSKETTLDSSKKTDKSTGIEHPVVDRFPIRWKNDDENDEFEIVNNPTESIIRMKHVKVLSISSGTTFQIGSSDSLDLESRHIHRNC
jgi:hypothetical protein